MYKQVTTPNFDPYIKQGDKVLSDWLGWCMAYVEQSVDVFYQYNTAADGWNRVKGRHTDAVPNGVWVLLWYSGYKGMGHVLWAKLNSDGSGTAYTSPNTHKPYADKLTFSSLSDLTKKLQKGWSYDLKLLGWSEYVGSKQIVKKVAAPKPAPKPTTGDYKVVKSIKGYVNSADAKAGKHSNSTVPAGTYYTFSQANGMRNITRNKGVPGWWINPGDNKTATAAKKVYVTVKAGWGLSNIAQAAGFKDAGSPDRWVAIAKLNGSKDWKDFNKKLKPGQKVMVK